MFLELLAALQSDGGGLAAALRERPAAALPALFLAGLATSVTPCVYPMIPITAGILGAAGAGAGSRGRTVLLSLTYAVGLALVYALLGVLAGLTGSLFGTVSSSPWAYLTIGNLLLVFGLGMLGVFELKVPQRAMAWINGLNADRLGGVFLMGATSGLVAAPCGAPVFAAVLTFVAATQSAWLGFVYLFTFSLGMSLLLVLVGTISGFVTALPKSGPWLVWVKRASGVLLLSMAEYYFIQVGKVS
jgi:thiol:disulfide interchange protein DsbD